MSIGLKELRFHEFDQTAIWPTKVRNVSNVGSHTWVLVSPGFQTAPVFN